MAPPNPLDLAAEGIRTLRAFGQRIPGAGDVLARSLEDAVNGRTVMITGASSGIGKAAALEIGEAGGTMLLVARRQDQLRRGRSRAHPGLTWQSSSPATHLATTHLSQLIGHS